MKYCRLPVLLGLFLSLVSPQAYAAAEIDAARISEIVRVAATTKPDGVVRVSWPRNDVAFQVDGLAFRRRLSELRRT